MFLSQIQNSVLGSRTNKKNIYSRCHTKSSILYILKNTNSSLKFQMRSEMLFKITRLKKKVTLILLPKIICKCMPIALFLD